MRLYKIFDEKTGQLLISMNETEDIVNVNPINYYGNFFIFNEMVMGGIPFDELKGDKPRSEISMSIFYNAIKLWDEKLQEIKKVRIPQNLITLLKVINKKDQEKLLSGLELNPMILSAFIFEAYSNYGFKFSQYKTEILPSGIDKKQMPIAAELDDNDNVTVYGKTELSKGQIKQAISQRKVMIGKFIERDDVWHCFFANYRSLNGDEIWLGKNQPHFHYISNSFGLTREIVVSNLKSKNYKLGNLPHIKLKGYGNQPE